jgi:hypothetical protein
VSALVIERYKTRLDAPKAHALSPRSLELCRQFGIDVNEIRKLGTKRVDAYWVNFLTSLNGHYAGCLPYERMDMEVLADTPHVRTYVLMNSLTSAHQNILSDDPQYSPTDVRGARCGASESRWSSRGPQKPLICQLQTGKEMLL